MERKKIRLTLVVFVSISLLISAIPVWAEKAKLNGKIFVETNPKDARIRILNIKPKFYQGIELKPGKYHIEVSADGYEIIKKWVEIGHAEKKIVSFTLNPINKSAPKKEGLSNSEINDLLYGYLQLKKNAIDELKNRDLVLNSCEFKYTNKLFMEENIKFYKRNIVKAGAQASRCRDYILGIDYFLEMLRHYNEAFFHNIEKMAKVKNKKYCIILLVDRKQFISEINKIGQSIKNTGASDKYEQKLAEKLIEFSNFNLRSTKKVVHSYYEIGFTYAKKKYNPFYFHIE